MEEKVDPPFSMAIDQIFVSLLSGPHPIVTFHV